MKYKVGDKVRVRKDLIPGEKYGGFYSGIGMEEYKGKKAIIECIIGDSYRLNLDDEYYWWTDEMLEPVNKTVQNTKKSTVKSGQFTKEDLKFGDVVTLRNENITIYTDGQINGNDGGYIFTSGYNKDFVHDNYDIYDIMKVERYIKNRNGSYNLTTLYERKEEILDEKEKEYLAKVIEPFRKRIVYIEKAYNTFVMKEYIDISFEDDSISLPYFEKNTMYKGMEVDKKYTLKELGI